jgi:PAS domain S-box-containing protein
MAALEPPPLPVADVLGNPDRLAAAARLLLDLPGRGAYDRLAGLAARLADAPAALVCIITDCEHPIGRHGLPEGSVGPLPLDGSPCAVSVELGAAVVAPDATAHDRLAGLPAVSDGSLAAYLGVPLIATAGHVVGTLSVFDWTARPFSSDDVTALEQLAASVVAELELAAANAAILTSLSRLDVALEASSVGIWDVDLNDGMIHWDERCAAVFGLDGAVELPSVEQVLADHIHPDDHEVANEAMASAIEARGEYVVEIRAVRPDGEVRWFVARGRVIVDADGEAARLFGTIVDVTEAKAQAEDRLLAVRRSAAVAEVAAELANATRMEQLVEVTVRAAESIGAAMGGLAVLEQGGTGVRLFLDQRLSKAVVEVQGAEVPAQAVELPLDDALPAQYVARTGETVLLPTAESAAQRFPDMARLTTAYGVQAIAALPLRVEGRLLGSFSVVWREDHALAPDELDVLEAFTAQIALTLSRLQADAERGSAVAAMAQANQRLELLAEAGRVLSDTLDITRQIEQLAELVVPPLGDWCWIVVTDEQGRLFDMASAHRDPALRAELERYVGTMVTVMTDEAAARVVAGTGRPLIMPEIDRERIARALPDPGVQESLDRLGVASGVVVPLVARGQTLGALGLFNDEERGVHTAAEFDTAVEIGRRAGLALHQARLYGQQRDLADALQRSMLTAPPEPDHCEIAVRYVPAAEGAEIGGDWYDAFIQENGATVLAIGDVVGHDTRAAAAMGQVRGLLRGIGYSSGGMPSEILAALDRAVQGLALDTMATALVGRLEESDEDFRAGRMWFRWSSAGHPAPIVIGADGSVTLLDGMPADLLLGVAPHMPREDKVACLSRGATVLLYTDGLVERRDRDVDAGTAELMTFLRGCAELSLEELCDRVLERMFLPDAEDDVAMLAVRLCPEAPPEE